MALDVEVLREEAKKLELNLLQKNEIPPSFLSELEELLNDVYITLQPNPSDYDNRREIVRVFNDMAKEIYGRYACPVVEAFGSFLMDLFCPESDLDLSVNFSSTSEYPRDHKIKTLKKFATKLYALQRSGYVSSVQRILGARVPIVKVIDCGTGIECDISVENRDGISKSQIVHIISAIDERFPKLSFLMKAWAKAQDINSSKDRTLNSLSIVSFVAFHLQTRNPPILPPFSVIFKDGTDPVNVEKIVHDHINYGKENNETVAELFVTLLIKLASVEALWENGICASTYEGAWISKTWDSEIGCISVEDFSIRTENLARVVRKPQADKIYDCIHHSLHYLLEFKDGYLQRSEVRELLFGLDHVPAAKGKGTTNHNQNVVKSSRLTKKEKKKRQFTELANHDNSVVNSPIPPDPIPPKRIRLAKCTMQEPSGTKPSNVASLASSNNRQRRPVASNVVNSPIPPDPFPPKMILLAKSTTQEPCGMKRNNVASLASSNNRQRRPVASNLGCGVSSAPQKLPVAPTQNPLLLEGVYRHLLHQCSPLINPMTPNPFVSQLHYQNVQSNLNQEMHLRNVQPNLNQQIYSHHGHRRLNQLMNSHHSQPSHHEHTHSQSFQPNFSQHMRSQHVQPNLDQHMHSKHSLNELMHSPHPLLDLNQGMHLEHASPSMNQQMPSQHFQTNLGHHMHFQHVHTDLNRDQRQPPY